MLHEKATTARIVVGEDCVTLWRRGSSRPTVALILGRQSTPDRERITVDRVLHLAHDVFEDGWQACGAFVSEFTRDHGAST